MFVADRVKLAVNDYLARTEVVEIITRHSTQEALRDALVVARQEAEYRQMSNAISQELISQRVSV